VSIYSVESRCAQAKKDKKARIAPVLIAILTFEGKVTESCRGGQDIPAEVSFFEPDRTHY
jgi:hypothetical protein